MQFAIKKISNNLIKLLYIFYIFLYTYFFLEFISIYVISEFINDVFILNLDYKLIINYINDFNKFFILILILSYTTWFLFLLFCANKIIGIKTIILFLITTLLFFIMFYGDFFKSKYRLLKDSFIENKVASMKLDNLDRNFYDKSILKSRGEKNIIFIFLESFEEMFIDDYPELTTNLNILKKKYNYHSLIQNRSSFTTGSIYSFLTGLPPRFGTIFEPSDTIFSDVNSFNFINLGDVLKTANYNMTYILANSNDGGMSEIINASNFKTISNKQLISKKNTIYKLPTHHDYDVFNQAKETISLNIKENKKFAVFINTLDTHFPNGRQDGRMEKILNKKINSFDNPMEFSIMSTDYLIGDFMDYLETNNILDNTVFYITPDHRMMGKNKIIKRKKNDRDLYLLTNAELFETERKLLQSDLTKIFISGSKISTSTKFFDFLKYNNEEISSIELNDLNINKKKHKKLNLKNDGLNIYLYDDRNLVFQTKLRMSNYNLVFDSNFILTKIINEPNNKCNEFKNRTIKNPITLCININSNSEVNSYLTNFTNFWISLNDNFFISNEFIKNIIDKNNEIFIPKKSIFYKDKRKSIKNISKAILNKDRFILHAGGSVDGHIMTNSLDSLNSNYDKGYRYFELDILKTADGSYVAVHDWASWITNSLKYKKIPTHSEFMSTKIKSRFEPLDFDSINDWFKKRNDAYLITDKIDDVDFVYQNFYDKNKVIMELFNIDNIKKAIKYDMNFLINWRIVPDLKKDHPDLIKKIKFAAVSYITPKSTIDFLNKNNIKSYVFHLNKTKVDNPEEYIMCNKLDDFYGIYVDQADFVKKINCS